MRMLGVLTGARRDIHAFFPPTSGRVHTCFQKSKTSTAQQFIKRRAVLSEENIMKRWGSTVRYELTFQSR